MGTYEIKLNSSLQDYSAETLNTQNAQEMNFTLNKTDNKNILNGTWTAIDKAAYSYNYPKVLSGEINEQNFNSGWFSIHAEVAPEWKKFGNYHYDLLFTRKVESEEWINVVNSGDYQLFTTPAGNICQMTVPADLWNIMQNPDTDSSEIEFPLAEKLFSLIKPEYDFVIFIYNLASHPAEPVDSRYAAVYQSHEGLGWAKTNSRFKLNVEDSSLKGIIRLNRRSSLLTGPALHELLHHWGVGFGKIFNLMQFGPHWGVSSVNGQLGGFDSANTELVEGTIYRSSYFGTVANGGNSIKYAPLELYMMGLIPSNEVPDFIVANDERIISRSREDDETIFTVNSWDEWSMKDLISLYGERKPDYLESQKVFSILPVLIGPVPDKGDNSDFLSTVYDFFLPREKPIRIMQGIEGSFNFFEATGGRARIELSPIELKNR